MFHTSAIQMSYFFPQRLSEIPSHGIQNVLVETHFKRHEVSSFTVEGESKDMVSHNNI